MLVLGQAGSEPSSKRGSHIDLRHAGNKVYATEIMDSMALAVLHSVGNYDAGVRQLVGRNDCTSS